MTLVSLQPTALSGLDNSITCDVPSQVRSQWEPIGQARTKTCTRCHVESALTNFSLKGRGTEHRSWCKDCIKKVCIEDNKKIAAVSSLAFSIAGGSGRFYRLPKEDRLKLREHAKFLHANSVSIGQATQFVEERSRAGFVYIVSNPAWPGYVKIGHAFDPADRLASFNCGDPHRAYRVEHTRYFDDRMKAEAWMHADLAPRRAYGEWFVISAAEALVRLNVCNNGDPV